MNKFKSNLIMFLLFIGYEALVLLILFKTPNSKIGLLVGVVLSFIYAMVCFFNKKVRSKMTRWWGYLSLLTCAWWIYLLTQ
jgi:hypothetical protein